jgi:hypothetical protein
MAIDRVALLNSVMDEAIVAISGGDYATAIAKALAAQGLLATLPANLSRSAGVGGGAQAVGWDASGIDSFIKRLQQQQGATLGVQTCPVVMVEPSIVDDGSQFANSSGGYVQ